MLRLTALASLTVLASCVYGDVADIGDAASIEVIDRPEGFGSGSGFGRVVTGWFSDVSGEPRSRYAVTSAPGAGHEIFGLWRGDERDVSEPLFDGCDDPDDCDDSSGAALVGIPSWVGGTDCLVIGSPAQRTLRIQCESSSTILNRLIVPETEGFGSALAAIDANPAGAFVVGAPQAETPTELGEISVVLQDDPVPHPLVLDAMTGLAAGARLGTALATAPLGGDVLVVAAAPGMERVIAFRLSADPADFEVETLACLDGLPVRGPGADVGQGGALAAGDLNGDGLPEIVVGAPGANQVRVLDGTSLAGAAGCTDAGTPDDPATTAIDCAALAAPSVATCGGFGAAVATADVNGDGQRDLVVGAPGSTVDGKVGAGALYTIPGTAGGLDAAGARGLGVAEPSTDAYLGEALAAVPSQLTGARRDEIVVGVPGESRLFVFWCTGVAGDDAAEGRTRCLD